MKTLKVLLIVVVIALLGAFAAIYSGAFDVAADVPHSALTMRLLELTRERSITRGAADIAVPGNLADPTIIAGGAGEYAEMCTGCHLAPGMEDTEMRAGLYPKPPELAKIAALPPAKTFWIIKHGIKMTGMPAWGLTHDDETVWSMVAFLQKLPGMSEADYAALVGAGGGHHHHDDGDGDESDENAAGHADAGQPAIQAVSGAAAQAAAVVDDFQHRLHHGDTDGAARLLDPSVLILEGGNAEKSRAEYASHHLKADAEFLRGATLVPISRTGKASGDLAWIATESEIRKPNAKSLLSTETMVLEKSGNDWRITHVHWSSREKP